VVADQKLATFGDFESGAVDSWFEYHTEAIKSAFTVEPGGANGTKYSAHFAGGPVIGFGARIIRPLNCLDVSHYDGLELWVKSARITQLEVIISTPETLDTKVGGDCHHNCLMPVTKIRVSDQWQRYRVPFDAFRSGSGLGVHGLIMGINIGAAGTFELWIDQVGLYSDASAKTH
jgi:hypothetical protein